MTKLTSIVVLIMLLSSQGNYRPISAQGLETPLSFCVRNGKDGRVGLDGKDGENGRDGKDGKSGAPGVCNCTLLQLQRSFSKPSIHLDGKLREVQRIRPGKIIDVWDHRINAGHISGGMMYSKGAIIVPLSGLYSVYCQIFYTSKAYKGRHALQINDKRVALAHARGLQESGTAITMGTFYVNQGDKLSVIMVYHSEIFTGEWHTFFGAHLI